MYIYSHRMWRIILNIAYFSFARELFFLWFNKKYISNVYLTLNEPVTWLKHSLYVYHPHKELVRIHIKNIHSVSIVGYKIFNGGDLSRKAWSIRHHNLQINHISVTLMHWPAPPFGWYWLSLVNVTTCLLSIKIWTVIINPSHVCWV